MLLCFSDVAEVPLSAAFFEYLAAFVSTYSHARKRKKPRKNPGLLFFKV
jgi:hypothetical protein